MKIQRTTITGNRVDVVFGDDPDPEQAEVWINVVVKLPEIDEDWPVAICRALAVEHVLDTLYQHNRAAQVGYRYWDEALKKAGLQKPG